jgi:hypothetical protein
MNRTLYRWKFLISAVLFPAEVQAVATNKEAAIRKAKYQVEQMTGKKAGIVLESELLETFQLKGAF